MISNEKKKYYEMICDKVRHGVFWKAGKRLLAQPPKCVGGFLGH